MTWLGEVDEFLGHLERGEFHRAVDGVLALRDSGVSCADIVTELLAPVQTEVGARWESARWSVADEHLVTAVVDDVLGALSVGLPPAGSRTLALCSAEGEWHVTPLRMGALVLREEGWTVRLLGASTPPDHLRDGLRHLQADVVTIHCALPTNLHGVPGVAAVAHEAGLPVLAAGRGFGIDDHRALRLGCDGWAPDIRAGARLATAWLDAPPPLSDPPPRRHAEELALLHQGRADIAADALQLLEHWLPAMARYDDRQRGHTHRDLLHILDAVEATMLVEDPRILDEFLVWLRRVLSSRSVPGAALTMGLEALAAAVSPELPAAHELLQGAATADGSS